MNGLYIHLLSGKYLLSFLIYSNSFCLSFFFYSRYFLLSLYTQIMDRFLCGISFLSFIISFDLVHWLSFLFHLLFYFLFFSSFLHFIPPAIFSLFLPFSPSNHSLPPPILSFLLLPFVSPLDIPLTIHYLIRFFNVSHFFKWDLYIYLFIYLYIKLFHNNHLSTAFLQDNKSDRHEKWAENVSELTGGYLAGTHWTLKCK